MTASKKSSKLKVVAPKAARPLYSGSPVLEASYAAFVSKVIEENIQTLRVAETDDARFLTIAGTQRLCCVKKTGLFHCESWHPGPEGGKWEIDKGFFITNFWHSNVELTGILSSAWYQQFDRAIPSQEECYPNNSPKYRYQRNVMVSRAAQRRLGGKQRIAMMLRMLTKALWDAMADRDTLRLCHAFFGRKATLTQYNFTVRHKKKLQARAAETPNLTRLVGAYIDLMPGLRNSRKALPMDVVAQARAELFKASRFPPGRGWDERQVFTVFPNQDLTPVGWRYLVGMTGAAVERLWSIAQWDLSLDSREGHTAGAKLAVAINLLAKTGEQVPLTFAKWVVNQVPSWGVHPGSGPYQAQLQESCLRLVRLAAQQAHQAKKKGRLKQFVKGDLVLVWDWFSKQGQDHGVGAYRQDDDAPPPPLLSIPKNATWASLMRAQHEWHAQRAERERLRREADARVHAAWQAKRDAITWESALDACEVDGVHARPLVSGKDLRTEGTEMNHCVGSYVEACERGNSRIFALEHKGNRATVELLRSAKNSWSVRQVFGPGNSNVSKPLSQAAAVIAKMYQKANQEVLAKAA